MNSPRPHSPERPDFVVDRYPPQPVPRWAFWLACLVLSLSAAGFAAFIYWNLSV